MSDLSAGRVVSAKGLDLTFHPGDIVLAPLTRDHMLPLAQRLAARAAGELR